MGGGGVTVTRTSSGSGTGTSTHGVCQAPGVQAPPENIENRTEVNAAAWSWGAGGGVRCRGRVWALSPPRPQKTRRELADGRGQELRPGRSGVGTQAATPPSRGRREGEVLTAESARGVLSPEMVSGQPVALTNGKGRWPENAGLRI